nr:uncharacterized protein LOC109767018 [Aegilops tauschii subsp. strangulata]
MGRSGGPPPPPSNFSAHLHHPNPVPSRTAMAPVMRVGLSRPDQSSTAAAPSVVASASSRPTPASHGGTPTAPFPASQESASAMDAEASVGHTTGMSGNVGQTGAPTKRRAACSATKEEQGDSMEWTDEYVQIVCSLMVEQVGQGNRPNTHLNPLGYNTVSERFYQMTGISLSKTQLKNKWDKLKGDWSCWNKLMRKQTGTGWDSSKGVIVMDNEWWKKARKDIPGCGKFRKKPLQNLEHLSKMFGDILNDEQDHWNPMSDNPIIPPSQEIFVDADNVVGIGEEEVHDIPDDIGNVVGGEEDEVHEVSPCIANAKKYLVFFLKKIRSQSQAQHLLSKIKSQR